MSNLCDNPMGSKGSKGPKGLMGFELVKFAFPTPGALEPGFERMGFSLAATHHTQDVAPYRQGHTNCVFNRKPTNVAGLFAAEHAPCTRGMASRTRNSYGCSDTTVDPQRVRRVLSTLRLRRTNTAPLDRSLLMKYVSKLTACLVFTCAAVLPTIASAIVAPPTIIETPRYPAPTGNECERTGITIPETGPIVVRDNYGGSTLLMVQCRDIILALGRPVVLGGNIWSSPTFLLTLPISCAESDAVFAFHASRHKFTGQLQERNTAGIFHTGSRHRLAQNFADNWNNRHFTFVQGSELAQFDVPVCAHHS